MQDYSSVAEVRKTLSSNANVVARFCAAMNVMYAVQGPIALSLCRTELFDPSSRAELIVARGARLLVENARTFVKLVTN